MLKENLKKALRFYFLTDENAPEYPPLKQVEIALKAGATMIQYRHKSFSACFFDEVVSIRNMCKSNAVPFIINDNIFLAKAVAADGVHLGQEDEPPSVARRILGPETIVGISVSNLKELKNTDLRPCDYLGTGPVFPTQTKADAKKACGLSGLQTVVKDSPLPVVAIGGINAANADSCFKNGANGVAVISYISRAEKPQENADRLGSVCGCHPRPQLSAPWQDEFQLIEELLALAPVPSAKDSYLKIQPGDDACLLRSIQRPVISTDTQMEGIHFYLNWQTLEEIGKKAVAVTLSDLAASYARPACLFVNLGLPVYIAPESVGDLYKGIKKALLKYNCELGGGNISKSSQFSIDLFAVGQGHDDLFPTRSAARPGFGLYCTGHLGLARAGLDALRRRDISFQSLLEKFKLPSARFDAAEVLACNQVACVIDISDGLAGDAAHIAKASNITIALNLRALDYHSDLLAYCQKYNLQPEEMILSGGEDYELLFACPPTSFTLIKKDLPNAFLVGECLPFSGKLFSNLPSNIIAFQHGSNRPNPHFS
jgi:thiamin-phosphate kinase